jgi:hypothetical protein
MFCEYQSDDHEAQATALLAQLGKFVVSFERVCAGMRSCLYCAFRKEGLTNLGLCQAVVHGKGAAALRETLGAVYAELNDQDDDDKNCVKSLLLRIRALAEQRNRLLHAEWHLNYDYDGADETFYALALRLSANQKNGSYAESISVSAKMLSELIKEATEIQVLLHRLAICLNQKGFKVSEMFGKSLTWA